MVAVALVSAFIAMRLAIHGREAVVPALTGLAVDDGSDLAERQGLRLNRENRFYSTEVPAGHILAQDPAPGSRVRREWTVRITESLGPQRVAIPDLSGKSERAATISIRRISLETGVVAHLQVPGDPDVVLTQTPPANSGGVDSPRVSLLVSDPLDAQPAAYVMPSLIGLSYAQASARAASAGLHLEVIPATPPPAAAVSDGSPGIVASPLPSIPAPTSGIVVAQTPPPDHRVLQGDAVHVSLGQATLAPGTISPR